MRGIDAIPTFVARTYVGALISILGRGLVAVGHIDAGVRAELDGLPEGFTFEMKVLPTGAAFRVRKQGSAFHMDPGQERPSLSIQFKHLRHALRVLLMVDDVGRAIADNRLVIDGELGTAMSVKRIIERTQSLLLPKELSAAPRSARLFAAMAAEGA